MVYDLDFQVWIHVQWYFGKHLL